jgi:hypothetical protein
MNVTLLSVKCVANNVHVKLLYVRLQFGYH